MLLTDHVFSNPPYFRPDAIQAVHPGRQGAYLADVGLEDWLKFMLHTVRPRGRITLIHRAGELARILGFMESRFGEIEIMPIRSRRGMPAKRVIVTGRKGLRRGEVLLHDGLVLFDGPDQPTARAEAIYGLIWGFLNRNNRPPPPVSLEDKRAEREKRKRNRDDPRD